MNYFVINIFVYKVLSVFRLLSLGYMPTCLLSCSVLSNSLQLMDCSPPGSPVLGIFQAKILEWVVTSYFRGSSQPRDGTSVSCVWRITRSEGMNVYEGFFFFSSIIAKWLCMGALWKVLTLGILAFISFKNTLYPVKHKLESSLLGEISITSDTQLTPPLWQKAKN